MNFCFSTFIKLFKKHAKNKQMSDASIVEALFCNSCDALLEKNNYSRYKIVELIEEQKDSLIPVLMVNKTKFYLLPISEFDKNNTAHSSVSSLEKAIIELLKFYDLHDQGETMYIPLIGTGLSRAGLNHNDSFKLIKDTMLKNKEYINGTISIVLYEKDIGKFEDNEYGIQK